MRDEAAARPAMCNTEKGVSPLSSRHRTIPRNTPSVLIILALFIGVSCTPPAERAPDDRQRFASFVSSYFSGDDERGSEGPVFEWLRTSGDSLKLFRTRHHLAQLRSIDTAGLTLDERIDWMLLEASFKRTLKDSVLRLAERSPSRYLTLGSLQWKVGKGRSPDEKTWHSVLSTLSDAPIALTLGRDRLIDPPALWVRLALGTIGRYEEYLREDFPGIVGASAPAHLQDSLLTAAQGAWKALATFGTFLEDSVVAGGAGSWAVGSEYYTWLLHEYHFLPYDTEDLIRKGWEVHNATKRSLLSLAEASGTGSTWQELVEQMKQHHPAPGRITDAYRKESMRARSLLLSTGMIDIPPAETLIFVPTPPALRETYAWGGYGGITDRDSVMTGRFFVTDVDENMGPLETEQKLRTQNTGWITVIALHEGYPGHHLQSVYARLNPQKVRSRFGSTYFGEGWALYCESWMGRNGFYIDRWDSLGWLNMRLWRTARVIVDPSLHSGRMSYEQAVKFFMDEVGLERSAAEAEVNRYTTWPTQAPSYIIGWLEIEDLKSSLRGQYGRSVTDKAFAESMLRMGSLPPALLRRSMEHTWAARKMDLQRSAESMSQ